MSTLGRGLLDEALRLDLSTFVHMSFRTLEPTREYQHNWHLDALAWHLHQCSTGEIKRLLITLPPRNLKSMAASVAFPAWLLGKDPSKRIICASYGETLAERFSRDCRKVIGSPWY